MRVAWHKRKRDCPTRPRAQQRERTRPLPAPPPSRIHNDESAACGRTVALELERVEAGLVARERRAVAADEELGVVPRDRARLGAARARAGRARRVVGQRRL